MRCPRAILQRRRDAKLLHPEAKGGETLGLTEASGKPLTRGIMEIQFEQAGPVLIVVLKGRFDAAEHGVVQEAVSRELESSGGKGVVFDLSGLNYVSSAGFREFFLIGRHLQRVGGGLAVCSLQPSVQRIFEIAQFQTAYPVCTSRDEALVALGSSVG